MKTFGIPKPSEYYLFNSKLLKRHELACPPKEAYLFFPKQTDIMILVQGKPEKTLRRIFTGVEFTAFEDEKLNDLKKEVTIRSINIPNWWEESETRRFLQATSYDIDKTLKIIQQQVEWRQSFFPLSITDHTISILNSGFMYIHGRDNNFRPIFVIQAAKYFEIKEAYPYDELFLAIIYFLEYILHNLLISGQVENWIMISDLTDVNIIFMPSDLKKLIDALSSCYRCRLFKNYILGLGQGMRWLYKLATSFLDEVTLQKINVLEKSKWNLIQTHIHPDNLERKFGGNASNVKQGDNHFFPPVMPTNIFSLPGDNLLLTEGDYKEKCKGVNGNKPVEIGLYYIEKWDREAMEEKREIESKTLVLVELTRPKTLSLPHSDVWEQESEGMIRSAKTSIQPKWEIHLEQRKGDNYFSLNSTKSFYGLANIFNFKTINNTSPQMIIVRKELNIPILKKSSSVITDLKA